MKKGISFLRHFIGAMALSVALAFICLAQQATGQAPTSTPQIKEYPNARVEALAREWTRARDYTKEYLDAMPEESYKFKPTPEVKSFAEQMLHLAGGNFNFGARVFGKANPYQGQNLEKMEDKSKTAVMKVVLESYDFVISGVKGMSDTKLDERLPMAGYNRPRTAVLAAAFEHQTHHRGQTTIYLRLKGITPPSEKLF